jgi:hypothetical protein
MGRVYTPSNHSQRLDGEKGINSFMKSFKKFLNEIAAPALPPPDVISPNFSTQPDHFLDAPDQLPSREFWMPWRDPGPRPDINDPKYQGKEGQKQFQKDWDRWLQRQRINDSYKELCPNTYGCKGISTFPDPFTTPPAPGVQYYIGPDGRVYEYTDSDETGNWEWILIKPGINVYNAPADQHPLYRPQLPVQP